MADPPSNYYPLHSGGAPPPSQQPSTGGGFRPPQFPSSIPTTFSIYNSGNAVTSSFGNASRNSSAGGAAATTAVTSSVPAVSRATATTSAHAAARSITTTGSVTIVGAKVTTTSTASSNNAKSSASIGSKVFKRISVPPPHPSGRYANETLAILRSASTEKKTEKSREDCINILESLVPPLFLPSSCVAKNDVDIRNNVSGGQKRKSMSEYPGHSEAKDGERQPKKSKISGSEEALVDKANGSKTTPADSYASVKASPGPECDDNKGSDLQNFKSDLKNEFKHHKLQNELLMERRNNVFQNMVKLHELYESGLDGIARMGDLRNVPDNVMSSKLHLS